MENETTGIGVNEAPATLQRAAGTNGNGAGGSRSESLAKLVEALALAQMEFGKALKDTKNPYFNSNYADLSAIMSATQPALAKHGLVVIQLPVVNLEEAKAGVQSLLVHSSGEWISNELILPATMQGKDGKPRFDAQSVGSAVTYSRRYAYQSIVGIAAEVDDDGNAASGISRREAQEAYREHRTAEVKAQKGQPARQEARTATQDDDGTRTLGGILKGYQELSTNKGQKYFVVMVDAEEVRIWGNPKFGEPPTTFEQLCAFGQGQFCQFVVQSETKGGKTYTMIRAIRVLAGRQWDDDGTEVIAREPGA